MLRFRSPSWRGHIPKNRNMVKYFLPLREQTRKFGVTNKGKTYKTVAKCYILKRVSSNHQNDDLLCYILNLYEEGRVGAVFL